MSFKRECFTGSAEIFQVCVGLLAHPWNFLRTIRLKTRGPLQAIGLQRGCFVQLGADSFLLGACMARTCTDFVLS